LLRAIVANDDQPVTADDIAMAGAADSLPARVRGARERRAAGMRYRTTNYERWRAAADTFAIAMSDASRARSGLESLNRTARARRSPGTDLGTCFIARLACTASAMFPATDAVRSSCLAKGGRCSQTDTDKNAALCSAPSTSPMTCSTMKLSRIISRAERVR
jgi:hypothetical protein